MHRRVEKLLQAQDTIRRLYRSGDIDRAIFEFDQTVKPEIGAVDPRVSRLARRLSKSFIQMVDVDLAKTAP